MISVIIPTYNRAKTIRTSIESVLRQTYKNFELIIVDDGSKDNTVEIVSSIKDQRIRIIHYSSNQGAAHARNVGIKESRGEYIAFHDSDDLMRPDRLELQLKFLEEQDAEFVFGRIQEQKNNGESSEISPESCNLCDENAENVKRLLLQWQVWCQTILCTKKCAESVLFDERFPCGIDWDFSIRVAQKYRMKYYPIICSDNIRLSSSISANSNNQFKCHFLMHEKYRDIIEQDSELRAFFTKKDFDFKYSFGYSAWNEAVAAFKYNREPAILLKGCLSLVRKKK